MIIGIVGWFFTLGGLIGFIIMLLHSTVTFGRDFSIFVFLGGFLSSFLLETYLITQLDQYSYQNLPLMISVVPVVIPCGWVVTYYGLYSIAESLSENSACRVAIVTVLGIFFGLAIESIARMSDFWDFHHSSDEFFFIPINALLAWGLTTMNFSIGLHLFARYKDKIIVLILIFIGVFLGNIIVAMLLSAD